jgi:hypothetical protein
LTFYEKNKNIYYLTRHQVVPVKRDSDSSGSKRKTSSTNISKYELIKNKKKENIFTKI